MDKRIIITGATGLIGKNIVPILIEKGYGITIFTRNVESAKNKFDNSRIKFIKWDYSQPYDKIIEQIENCFAVVNLAGASIAGKRWNDEYKKELYNSRVITTKKIADAISKCKSKPSCLINTSAIGFYGTDGTEVLNEESADGDDYLAKLCFDWEKEAMEAEKYGVRAVTLRIGMVLDKNEGALKKFLLPFKLFAGGYQGTGKQWISWIHIDDLINLIIFSIENQEIKGAINCTSPKTVSNMDFCKSLGKVLHRPSYFPVPGFILKLVIGDFAEYLLKGRKVIPDLLK
ncbi:MAG: TIGR01777 family oxidoreductase [Ignavibacteriae bacterium]|nr:TIGR01777 family oxidoreductase [Ignavibacteriota bacterium]